MLPTPEQSPWYGFCFIIGNFEQIGYVVVKFLLVSSIIILLAGKNCQ